MRKEDLTMNRSTNFFLQRLLAIFAIACFCCAAQAQDNAQNEQDEQQSGTSTEEETQSGYEDIAEFGGPESVGTQLKENDAVREARYRFDGLQRTLGPYFDWKRRVKEEHGVAFGTSLYLLYQKASDALPGEEDDALGHIFRYQGTWNIFQRDNGNSGRISWRLESRSHIGGFQAPGSLGSATGIRTLAPGFAYNQKFEFDVPVLSWVQHFANGKAGYAVGRLAFDVYLDAFPFQTLGGGFINRSSIYNPTMPTTGLGAIGGVVKGFISDNFWLGAQIYDANAVNGDFDLDTLEEGEWIKAVEIGYTPAFAERGTNRIQFTYWEKDARVLAGTPKGDGWAVSAVSQLSDDMSAFARFGHSDGGGGVAAENALSAGLKFSRRFDEIWTVGFGWANPSSTTFGPGLDDEFLVETSYKFQLSKNTSLTPDVQLVFNPAGNPSESMIWIYGLRVILTL
jgi:porin